MRERVRSIFRAVGYSETVRAWLIAFLPIPQIHPLALSSMT